MKYIQTAAGNQKVSLIIKKIKLIQKKLYQNGRNKRQFESIFLKKIFKYSSQLSQFYKKQSKTHPPEKFWTNIIYAFIKSKNYNTFDTNTFANYLLQLLDSQSIKLALDISHSSSQDNNLSQSDIRQKQIIPNEKMNMMLQVTEQNHNNYKQLVNQMRVFKKGRTSKRTIFI